MGFLKLTAEDNKQLFATLGGAFNVGSLMGVVGRSVPAIADEITLPAPKADVVMQVVGVANQHGLIDRLLVEASNDRPERPDLRAMVLALSQRQGWTAAYVRHGLPMEGLERLTSKGNPFLDVARLATWMIGVESHVCQVRTGDSLGTGFLIAPDLVMTNYHVIERHLKGDVKSSDVQVRFDFRVSPSGAAPSEDAPWEDIDSNWKIPNRPYSQADLDLIGDPGPTELDYAILKLARRAGEEQLVAGLRGWVDISKDEPLPAIEAPILIVQHPGQPPVGSPPLQPLKIAFATPGFDAPNANKTRVIYRPSTLKGSSGSPVFGPSFRAVALHHNRGQISDAAANLDKNNRGIPLFAIRADLGSRKDLEKDVLGMLAAPPKG